MWCTAPFPPSRPRILGGPGSWGVDGGCFGLSNLGVAAAALCFESGG